MEIIYYLLQWVLEMPEIFWRRRSGQNARKKCGGLHSFSVVPGKLRGGYTEKAVPLNSVPQGCLAALTGGLGDVQGGGLT